MKKIINQIKGIEFYRNIPFVDQAKGTPFIKRFFYFQKSKMSSCTYFWIEIPFIAARIKIKKQ